MSAHSFFRIKPWVAIGMSLCSLASHAALQARDLDPATPGPEAFYDTELNITWLSDFSYIKTSGYDADGRVTWDGAKSWIASLNSGALYGFNNWRLPKVTPVNGLSFQTAETNNGSTDKGVAATGVGWGRDPLHNSHGSRW